MEIITVTLTALALLIFGIEFYGFLHSLKPRQAVRVRMKH